ncbi:MAG: hypothetical protein ABWZ91_03010 [Nocardioides sp.]|jgi:hypothetical protein
MPDLEVLRDLTPQFPPPSLDDLAAVVSRRRRRAVLTAGAGAGALAAVVVVATMIGGMPSNDRSMDPVGDPTDGRTDRTAEDLDWAPERIRAEGDPLEFTEERDGTLDARWWIACPRDNCDMTEWIDNYDRREFHSALEVTVDGYRSSGLFDLNGGPGEWAEIATQPFDGDSFYVQDWSQQGGTQERYRLLNADGTTTDLTMLPTTAPPTAGPDVVRTTISSDGLARVDDTAGTIQPLDLPDAVFVQWAESAADELLWGVAAEDCVVYWQQPGGDFAHRELECKAPDQDPLMIDYNPRATSWFTADRMALIELGGSKFLPVALHVSLDRGVTWQRIPVTEDTMYDVLEQLG